MRFKVNTESEERINLQKTQLRQEFVKSFLFSALGPIVFITLKTSFFQKDVDNLIILASVLAFLLGIFTMVRHSRMKLRLFVNLIKTIDIISEVEIYLQTVGGREIKVKFSDFNIISGYSGPKKLEKVFDLENLYSIEIFKGDLKFYLIGSYFENWEDLKASLEKHNVN